MAKIGKTWVQRKRKVNGKTRSVKVRKRNGKYQVRLVGKHNLTDKTAKSYGRTRKKGVYSSTDKGARRHKIKRDSDCFLF